AYAWLLGRVARSRSVDILRVELIGLGVLYVVSAVFRVVISTSGYHLAENWLPAYLDVFVLGMFLAVLSVAVERAPDAAWLHALTRRAAVWWAGGAAVFLMISNMNMPIGLQAVPTATYMFHHFLAGLLGL